MFYNENIIRASLRQREPKSLTRYETLFIKTQVAETTQRSRDHRDPAIIGTKINGALVSVHVGV